MKILIVEDDLTSRTMLDAIARKWSYEPVSASSGEEAWQIMQQDDAPCLLLVDWMLPGMSGIDLCRRILQQDTESQPYIILLTARSETKDIIAGLDAGANDYIAKPFINEELRARLEVGQRMLQLQRELVQANAELQYQASHDALTGVLNHAAIMERLDRELARAKRQLHPLCIAMMDLDRFKEVNDRFGHLVGDRVLKEAVKRINLVIRSYDSLGRYGGEEFLLITEAESDDVSHAMERIRSGLEMESIKIDQHEVRQTISIGAVIYHPESDNRSASELVSAADMALYRAKSQGRNRVCMSD